MKKSPKQNFMTGYFNDLQSGKVEFFTASEFFIIENLPTTLQKPSQLLRYPLHLPLLPRPQRRRRLAGLEPELHHHLAPDRDEVEPRPQFRGAGVVQAQDAAPIAGGVVVLLCQNTCHYSLSCCLR